MTREVIYVQSDTPLAEVAEAMGREGISGVPVLNQAGKVVGVISEKDFSPVWELPARKIS